MATTTFVVIFAVVLFLLLKPGLGQIQQVNPGTSQTAFYLDNPADCDGRIREVGGSTVSVYGVRGNTQGSPVTSCTLTLNTENIREPHKFKIQFLAVSIRDPGTYLYVYDGEYNGKLRWAFSMSNQKPNNLDFDFSTGQLVTFRMTKGEREFNYDIRIVVTPVPSDVARCTYENEYGCDEYGYNFRILETKDIIGIVGGCFGLVILIVIIVVVCCYRKQKGISKKWTETKLGHVNTAASLHTLNGKVPSETATRKEPWTSESSRNGFASIRRSPNLPRAKIAKSRLTDADSSMSDSHASLPAKRPLPPPSHVSSNPRGASSRGRRSRFDRDSDRFSEQSYSDRSYSEKNFSEKNYSEKNYRPPTYREAIRQDDSDLSADETSFVQANDDHPQTVFVERVITPRVKPKKQSSPKFQRAPPPPEEDDTYDSIDPKIRANRKLLSKGTGVDESDSDNESNETEEEESEEEEEEEESDEENDEKEDHADNVEYAKPDKSRKSKANNKRKPQTSQQQHGAFVPVPQSQPPQQFPGGQYPGFPPPGIHQPQPRYGYPPQGQQQYPPQGQQPFMPQGQPFPQQPMPGQQFSQQPPQGQHHPHSYHQANFSVPVGGQQPPMMNPQQGFHGNQGGQPHREQSHKPKRGQSHMQPSHIPMYSHLVNRGFGDGRHSPVSTSTGASNLSGDRNLMGEDSDYSANIGAGVEVLRRK